MSFLELAKKRYSTRSFKPKAVEREKLEQVLEAGRIAPSAKNYQPCHLIVIMEEQRRREIAATYQKEWILQAPVIIVICVDHHKAWRRPDGKDHSDIDTAIVIDHMTLAATDLGLGTCWVCMFNAMLCHRILQLKDQMEVVALLLLGYPADEGDPQRHGMTRKKLEELVHWETF